MTAVMAAPPATVDVDDLTDELRAGRDRARRWLVSHLNADGSLGAAGSGDVRHLNDLVTKQ